MKRVLQFWNNQIFLTIPTCKPYLIFVLAFCCLAISAIAQETSYQRNKWRDSVEILMKEFSTDSTLYSMDLLQHLTFDSSAAIELREVFKMGSTINPVPAFPLSINKVPPARFLSFDGGYLSYNWNYRSSIDTPFQ
ncbi:MAG TPA: hypothetical protein VNS32_04705, partial [Flavisolibacter sp.]|nr:hypothetical protein [Flavisolibacter sp.]